MMPLENLTQTEERTLRQMELNKSHVRVSMMLSTELMDISSAAQQRHKNHVRAGGAVTVKKTPSRKNTRHQIHTSNDRGLRCLCCLTRAIQVNVVELDQGI
jgi:hypothetical protein